VSEAEECEGRRVSGLGVPIACRRGEPVYVLLLHRRRLGFIGFISGVVPEGCISGRQQESESKIAKATIRLQNSSMSDSTHFPKVRRVNTRYVPVCG
jgi:hypothetical protein